MKKILLIIMLLNISCVTTFDINHYKPKTNITTNYKLPKPKQIKTQKFTYGTVSWYGNQFNGRKTANGEIFCDREYTCAATQDIKFNTLIKVTNLLNNKSVIVRVNDRGGFHKYNRELDLSKSAFAVIADTKQGLVKTKIEIILT